METKERIKAMEWWNKKSASYKKAQTMFHISLDRKPSTLTESEIEKIYKKHILE
jgi:hypothetical protein